MRVVSAEKSDDESKKIDGLMGEMLSAELRFDVCL